MMRRINHHIRQRTPDFVCIGAQKAGTTWLYENLRKHADIGLPEQKELHYFDAMELALEQGYWSRLIHPFSSLKWRGDAIKRWRIDAFKKQVKEQILAGNLLGLCQIVDDLFHFRSHLIYGTVFSEFEEKMVGEITPAYACLEKESIERVYQLMPDIKIIFILRNPIDRAWSQARMNLSRQGVSIGNLSNEELIKIFSSQPFLKRGIYTKTLENWQTYYPDKQILICFFEDLVQRPRELIQQVCDFLELETSEDYFDELLCERNSSYAGELRDQLPTELRSYLAKLHYPELEALSLRFGSHAKAWLKQSDLLIP